MRVDASYDVPSIFDPTMTARVEYWVYLYTIARRQYTVHQAPLVPTLVIPPCPEGQRYLFFQKFPHPFAQVDRDVLHGDLIFHDRGPGHDGRRVAMSICNPDNMTLDQDSYRKQPRGSRSMSLGVGTNLSEKGVFWSLNNPPTEEEIKAAETRVSEFYRRIFDEAQSLAVSNQAALQEFLSIHGEDAHIAADFYGAETSWHAKRIGTAACPYCGEQIPPGAKYHKNSALGKICVIDVTAAQAAGAINEKQAESMLKARGEWVEPVKPYTD